MAATNHSIAVDYFPEPLSDEVDTPTDVGTCEFILLYIL